MSLTEKQAAKLDRLHAQAVKAAQRYEAATPGTQTQMLRWNTYENRERAFREALDDLTEAP